MVTNTGMRSCSAELSNAKIYQQSTSQGTLPTGKGRELKGSTKTFAVHAVGEVIVKNWFS
jgi:hypothetical protein